MKDHRIRLTDDDLAVVCAALSARLAMARGLRAHRIERLLARLRENVRGNPRWLIDDEGQTHEDLLDADELG